MRIGLITGEYPPLQGGVGAYTDVLARVFAERGHQAFIFSEPRAQQQHENIPLAQHSGWGLSTIPAIRQWIASNDLDIVNLQFQTAAFNMSPMIHFLPHFINKPFVTTFHDLRFPYLFPKAGKLRDWIVMHLAKASNGVIVTNYEDYEKVSYLPCVDVIPIGSNILADRTSEYDRTAWREKAGAAQDDFLLAYFGFINHSKGVDILLQALAELNQSTIKLVLIGGRTGTADPTNATYAASIDTLIENLNLSDKISWTGFVDDVEVSAYLRAADTIVLPFRDGASYRRGSLMAAIQHGCAIITTQPSHEDSPFSDDTMYLVAPDNSTELANAIQSLCKNALLRTQLQAGVTQLKQLFDWQSITEKYETLFERLIGEYSA
ncbi:MAG: glycosyltransferase [Anaerolineae bacterium]|nr:glycosyltransferase [Anaerolineae bacterium]MDQ7033389.1 glycosyltransferase [Anaerolineae bacterium]